MTINHSQSWLSTQMHIEHVATLCNGSLLDELDHACHALPFVHRVGNEGICTSGKLHCFDSRRTGNAVDTLVESLIEDDSGVGDGQGWVEEGSGVAGNTSEDGECTVSYFSQRGGIDWLEAEFESYARDLCFCRLGFPARINSDNFPALAFSVSPDN